MTSATMGEMDGLKAQLISIWAAGGGAREFSERLNITPGCQSLNIACRSGQLTLMAVKNGIEVIGVDIASNMVERARAGAQADRLNACFEETDAEAHSFDDASVEVVVSLTSRGGGGILLSVLRAKQPSSRLARRRRAGAIAAGTGNSLGRLPPVRSGLYHRLCEVSGGRR